MRFIQGLPEVDGRGKDYVGIADDVHEAGVGKQFEKRANARGMSRRFEDEPARVFERQSPQETEESSTPILAFAPGQTLQVERSLVQRWMIGESNRQVRRRLAHHAHGELVLLPP